MAVSMQSTERPTSAEPATAAEPSSSIKGRRELTRYLLNVLLVVSVLYIIPLTIVRTDAYQHRSLSFYSRPLNYAFQTPVKDADVILFGDSTVLLGVDPSQMSSDLGVEVLNLPNTRGSLMVNDDLTLRRYLSHNRPPKLIVFYFAPWDFDYGNTPFDAIPVFEGEEVLAAQGTFKEISSFARWHPSDAALFSLRLYADSWEFLMHKVSHQGQEGTLAATHGHIENTDPSVLASPCTFPPLLLDNIRFDWVKALGEKYASPQTRVLYFVAPVPSCTNVSALLNHRYDALPAALPVVLPPETFVRDIRYIHTHPDTVPQITRSLSDSVRSAIAPVTK
ncbi:hypothetical protein HDF16_003357 [Granulicella aggregans]|uniref:Uncharacterized protein n=1 Tax=Granulicella aggregans TaxID=474949 RepID=A0A7W7ZF10_9BACT|nr:hypothetical protein [Granulicella aggregans]MBB5058643.1 hypothetical protein [Granulicella aggregans]